MEEKGRKKIRFGEILVMFFIIVTFAGMYMGAWAGASDVADVNNASERMVYITAVTTSSDKYTDIDEGFERDYWHVNVSYEYNGTEYSEIYYDTVYKEPDIGKKVEVRIDPETPDKILESEGGVTFACIISPVLLAVLSGCVYFIIPKLKYLAAGGFLALTGFIFLLVKNSFVHLYFSIAAFVIVAVFNLIMEKKNAGKEDKKEA